MTRILLTACVLFFTACPLLAQTAGDEQRLKAAFVFRFPQFVVWPPTAWSDRETLEICVDRSGAAASALRELTAGESLNGRRLVVRDAVNERNVASCHVLMLPGDSWDRGLLTRAAALPILTVGDSQGFLEAGGIIQLNLVDRRVRFAIDHAAARRSGLSLSSQLLRLASAVRGGP